MCPKETRIVVQCDETTVTIILLYHSHSHLELHLMHNLWHQNVVKFIYVPLVKYTFSFFILD